MSGAGAGFGSGLKLIELPAVQAILRDFDELGQSRTYRELTNIFQARIDRLQLGVEKLPTVTNDSEAIKLQETGSLQHLELTDRTPISEGQRVLQEAYLEFCEATGIRVPEWEKEFEDYCAHTLGLEAVAVFWNTYGEELKALEARGFEDPLLDLTHLVSAANQANVSEEKSAENDLLSDMTDKHEEISDAYQKLLKESQKNSVVKPELTTKLREMKSVLDSLESVVTQQIIAITESGRIPRDSTVQELMERVEGIDQLARSIKARTKGDFSEKEQQLHALNGQFNQATAELAAHLSIMIESIPELKAKTDHLEIDSESQEEKWGKIVTALGNEFQHGLLDADQKGLSASQKILHIACLHLVMGAHFKLDLWIKELIHDCDAVGADDLKQFWEGLRDTQWTEVARALGAEERPAGQAARYSTSQDSNVVSLLSPDSEKAVIEKSFHELIKKHQEGRAAHQNLLNKISESSETDVGLAEEFEKVEEQFNSLTDFLGKVLIDLIQGAHVPLDPEIVNFLKMMKNITQEGMKSVEAAREGKPIDEAKFSLLQESSRIVMTELIKHFEQMDSEVLAPFAVDVKKAEWREWERAFAEEGKAAGNGQSQSQSQVHSIFSARGSKSFAGAPAGGDIDGHYYQREEFVEPASQGAPSLISESAIQKSVSPTRGEAKSGKASTEPKEKAWEYDPRTRVLKVPFEASGYSDENIAKHQETLREAMQSIRRDFFEGEMPRIRTLSLSPFLRRGLAQAELEERMKAYPQAASEDAYFSERSGGQRVAYLGESFLTASDREYKAKLAEVLEKFTEGKRAQIQTIVFADPEHIERLIKTKSHKPVSPEQLPLQRQKIAPIPVADFLAKVDAALPELVAFEEAEASDPQDLRDMDAAFIHESDAPRVPAGKTYEEFLREMAEKREAEIDRACGAAAGFTLKLGVGMVAGLAMLTAITEGLSDRFDDGFAERREIALKIHRKSASLPIPANDVDASGAAPLVEVAGAAVDLNAVTVGELIMDPEGKKEEKKPEETKEAEDADPSKLPTVVYAPAKPLILVTPIAEPGPKLPGLVPPDLPKEEPGLIPPDLSDAPQGCDGIPIEEARPNIITMGQAGSVMGLVDALTSASSLRAGETEISRRSGNFREGGLNQSPSQAGSRQATAQTSGSPSLPRTAHAASAVSPARGETKSVSASTVFKGEAKSGSVGVAPAVPVMVKGSQSVKASASGAAPAMLKGSAQHSKASAAPGILKSSQQGSKDSAAPGKSASGVGPASHALGSSAVYAAVMGGPASMASIVEAQAQAQAQAQASASAPRTFDRGVIGNGLGMFGLPSVLSTIVGFQPGQTQAPHSGIQSVVHGVVEAFKGADTMTQVGLGIVAVGMLSTIEISGPVIAGVAGVMGVLAGAQARAANVNVDSFLKSETKTEEERIAFCAQLLKQAEAHRADLKEPEDLRLNKIVVQEFKQVLNGLKESQAATKAANSGFDIFKNADKSDLLKEIARSSKAAHDLQSELSRGSAPVKGALTLGSGKVVTSGNGNVIVQGSFPTDNFHHRATGLEKALSRWEGRSGEGAVASVFHAGPAAVSTAMVPSVGGALLRSTGSTRCGNGSSASQATALLDQARACAETSRATAESRSISLDALGVRSALEHTCVGRVARDYSAQSGARGHTADGHWTSGGFGTALSFVSRADNGRGSGDSCSGGKGGYLGGVPGGGRECGSSRSGNR
jgi:hypothetical protein